jgi:hypothetical protein
VPLSHFPFLPLRKGSEGDSSAFQGGKGVKHKIGVLLGVLLWSLMACQSSSIFQGRSQEWAFRERYIQQPFYTAIFIHPYRYNEDYLIDLTGTIAELETETPRASVAIPLGSPITIVGLDDKYVLAHITGYTRLFRISLQTQHGTLDDVAKELALVLSQEPPLQSVRPEMRAFVERQEVTRGMTRREVSMSWGLPDKITSVPGATGTIEEWTYFDRRAHVFLDNSTVTNWQQF